MFFILPSNLGNRFAVLSIVAKADCVEWRKVSPFELHFNVTGDMSVTKTFLC